MPPAEMRQDALDSGFVVMPDKKEARNYEDFLESIGSTYTLYREPGGKYLFWSKNIPGA